MVCKLLRLSLYQPTSLVILSRVSVCLILLFAYRVCLCDTVFGKTFKLKDSLNDRTCPTDNNVLPYDVSSDISCLYHCSVQSQSISTCYKPSTSVCKCCSEPYDTPGGLPTDMGTEYYIIWPDPVCFNYLMSGSNEVDDSQLSESAHHCQTHDCAALYGGKSTDTSAIHARLNSKGYLTGSWIAPDYSGTTDYVQVDFHHEKTIAAIALQGRDPVVDAGGLTVNQYVTTFKILVSLDCNDFTYISYGAFADVIFEGNSSPDQIVVRHLPDRVIARCVRINPIEYFGFNKALRFDVIGC